MPSPHNAFGDAVLVDELLPSNPIERAKRAEAALSEPSAVDGCAALRLPRGAFVGMGCSPSSTSRVHGRAPRGTTHAGRVEHRPGQQTNHDRGSAGVVAGARIEGATKSARLSRVVRVDEETVAVLREHHTLKR